MTIETAIAKVADRTDLTFAEMNDVMNAIMEGKATDIQISSLLTALTVKHETVAEIAGAADAMRDHALTFKAGEPVLEIVGTGGDHANSFNISTTSSLVVAAAGTPVAKHGNRAASSKSGAADVLEALGVNINVTPETSEAILNQIGICFLFAQEYHQAMRFVAPVRKTLGIRTIFNVLGPLANPAHAGMQLLGVYDDALLEPMAHVLHELGVKNALVIHGTDGLDEASISAPTKVVEVRGDDFKSYEITPEQFGLTRAAKADIVGGTPADNAQITRDILAGKKGPKRDIVLLNAGLALYTAHPELSIEAAVQQAADMIDSGKAQTKLNELIALTKGDQVA
ncbi:anthranilate phosphoribosyltransferase [Secundilactobacillus similis]|jgi:anthranilate phosphoribosyltransferase|uniref:Anthranilate phosphoribosyltransferase n=1 Tax=Secundilactobacillus similis DSM 23365 = JCM 2765 TaxID=1423804 RepID=A0A0R2FE88_9LACO|nr:anthranilate phosphoribosyltransferase [Secundilactobacillus similis]KRN25659.1 anthranilate phosphoribosyltransferase [Secundilactobacillus similis DSM 23365 = JCM 2765]